jgi:hypothetical protein
MRRSAKRILAVPGVVVVFTGVLFGVFLWKAAPVVTGFEAKCLCSGLFVSRRGPASVLAEDLQPVGALYPLRFVDTEIDNTGRTVKASIKGFAERKAIFRDGLGCTLVIGITEEQLRSVDTHAPGADAYGYVKHRDEIWPDGETVDTRRLPPAVNGEKLNDAVEWAFLEPDPGHLRKTLALVIVYDGRIVAERYAPGFTANTPLPGWSMAKSVFAALTGILIDEGKLSLKSGGLLPLWREGQDPRRTITLDNLLRMSSGLAFQEDYSSPRSDVAVMLFGVRDMAAFAASKPLVSDPGAGWRYSSGGVNIISKVMRNTFGESEQGYLEFPRRALFDRVGMESALVEPDPCGTLVGSSFMFATARDWARFGLLYLRDGMWGKDRVLPEGWTQYCTTPAPASVKKEYGAGFWLRVPREFRSGQEPSAHVPNDAYHAVGYEGQLVSIIPSRKLVVVRLGLTHTYGTWDQEELIYRILGAFR